MEWEKLCLNNFLLQIGFLYQKFQTSKLQSFSLFPIPFLRNQTGSRGQNSTHSALKSNKQKYVSSKSNILSQSSTPISSPPNMIIAIQINQQGNRNPNFSITDQTTQEHRNQQQSNRNIKGNLLLNPK